MGNREGIFVVPLHVPSYCATLTHWDEGGEEARAKATILTRLPGGLVAGVNLCEECLVVVTAF